jgi:hypothetical protein
MLAIHDFILVSQGLAGFTDLEKQVCGQVEPNQSQTIFRLHVTVWLMPIKGRERPR